MNILSVLVCVILLILLMVLLIYFWTKSLRKAVKISTENLRREIVDHQLKAHHLAEKAQELNKAQNFSSVITAQISLDFKWIQVTNSFCNLVGFNQNELIGQDVKNVVLDSNFNLKIIKIKSLLNGQINTFDSEHQLRKKDKKSVWTNFNYTLARNQKLQPIYYLAYIQDISNVKNAEIKMIGINQELHNFVYRSSHDLRGPLASIMGLANVAKLDLNNPKAIYYFDLVIDRVNKLDKVLVELLELSLASNGEISVSKIDFEALINDVIHSLEHLKNFKNLEINLDIQNQKKFYNDYKLLNTIFSKIIDNAIKYQKGREEVKSYLNIDVFEEKDGVQIVFDDNGIGMSDKIKNKAFDIFYRGHEQSTGTGLGLYVTQKAIEKLKGKIQLETQQNEGTRISIFLPNLTSV